MELAFASSLTARKDKRSLVGKVRVEVLQMTTSSKKQPEGRDLNPITISSKQVSIIPPDVQ